MDNGLKERGAEMPPYSFFDIKADEINTAYAYYGIDDP